MPKSWREKRTSAKPAHVVVLEKPFAGVAAGKKLFITSPQVIERFMRSVAVGNCMSLAQMRSELAKSHNADAACPVTTSIHSRIVAEVALEDLASGVAKDTVVPFWRVIEPSSDLAKKLSVGRQGIEALRAEEVV